MSQWELAFNYGLPLATIVFAYFVGSFLERRHFVSIRKREAAVRTFPVLTTDRLPQGWQPQGAQLMLGNVVISLDYFKRIIAGLRALVGGRVKTYEPLLDRARREALLRLIETARENGYDALINVRLETSRLANSTAGEGTAGVEMIAFGTALKLRPGS